MLRLRQVWLCSWERVTGCAPSCSAPSQSCSAAHACWGRGRRRQRGWPSPTHAPPHAHPCLFPVRTRGALFNMASTVAVQAVRPAVAARSALRAAPMRPRVGRAALRVAAAKVQYDYNNKVFEKELVKVRGGGVGCGALHGGCGGTGIGGEGMWCARWQRHAPQSRAWRGQPLPGSAGPSPVGQRAVLRARARGPQRPGGVSRAAGLVAGGAARPQTLALRQPPTLQPCCAPPALQFADTEEYIIR